MFKEVEICSSGEIRKTAFPFGTYTAYLPSADLKPYIDKYYFTEGFETFASSTINPVGKENIEMHFHYGSLTHRVFDFQQEKYINRRAYIVGNYPMKKLYQSRMIDSTRMFTVEFTSTGLIRILHLYPSEFFNKIIDVEELFGFRGKNLINNIWNADDNDERIEIIEVFFRDLLKKSLKQDRQDRSMLSFMESRHIKTVKEFCSKYEVGRRRIERLFSKKVGLSPKEFLRIKRFNKACELLSQYPSISFSDIINDCHYFDQSHFIKEFRELVEMSPLKYLKQLNGFFYLGRGYVL
jgi:AraC-like DNA-binding protein